MEISAAFPVPIKGIDSDNGAEFINNQLLRYCEQEKITFTRSRVGRKNDGARVEQKNWSVVRRAVGYHRYDTPAELALLNEIYALLRLQINFFLPAAEARRQAPRRREGAQALRHRPDCLPAGVGRPPRLGKDQGRADPAVPRAQPAQLRRDILARSDRLLEVVKAKHQPSRLPLTPPPARRAVS
jgi:hypothetical protein